MFPSRFDYVAARSLDEAIAAKAADGDEARVLAGGQSLLPMMKLRLANPSKLVDINRIPGLDRIERDNGHLRVGALVRHADVVASDLDLRRRRGGGAVGLRPAGPQPRHAVRVGRPLRPRGRLELGAAGHRRRGRRPGPERRADDPDRRLRRRPLHQRARRRRDGDRGPHPGAGRTGRAAPTSSSSARSATTPPSPSPPTSSWPTTARSPRPASA